MAKTARSEAKKQSDKLRNIRRRYERAAARAIKAADVAESLEERSSLLKKAEDLRAEALKYYSRNITKAKVSSEEYKENIRKSVTHGEAQSSRTLQTAQQRNRMAIKLLKGNVGSQFFAATVQLWRDVPKEQRFKAILEKTGAPDLITLMERMSEATGKDYFEESSGEEEDLRYNITTVRAGMLYSMQFA